MSINLFEQKTVILGAGGHARSLLGLAKDCGLEVCGCVAPKAPDLKWNKDCPWLGDDRELENLDRETVTMLNGIGSIGSTTLRRKIFNQMRDLNYKFSTLLHPSAICPGDLTRSEGTQVFAGVIIQPGVVLAENVILNTGCIIEHDCKIGKHTHVAPGAVLSGNVTTGIGVHIGTGATIMQGVKLGDYAVIGAGAVVINNVEPRSTLVGNPAKPLCR